MNNDFQLGEWLVQPSRNRIQGHDRQSTIKLKSMAVLLRLVEAEGKVVPKQALLEAVWGDAIVTEDVLTQCIVELRKAFEDSASDPQIIETIRRVGFRLIPEVQPLGEEDPDPAPPPSRIAVLGIGWVGMIIAGLALGIYVLYEPEPASPYIAAGPSIAVLPFTNMSDDPENQYFSDGLAEELLDRLTKVAGLRVPARTSSFAFRDRALDIRDIGRRLGVSHVLEGSVRKSKQLVRITAQLIDVETGEHRWSQTFERKLDDVFVLQDEISEAIVNELRPNLAATAGSSTITETLDIGAYDLYLLRRHHLMQERTDRAREFFEKAIEEDVSFARAYAGLAESSLGFRDTPGSFWQAQQDASGLARAQWAIGKSLELNPRLPEAHTALAAWHVINRDTGAEETALRKALELKPDFVDALARLAANLSAQGRYREALVAYQRAAVRDPLNPYINAALSQLVAQTDGYEAALVYPLRLLDSDLPSPQIYQVLMSLSSDFGRYAERVKWGLRLVAVAPQRASALAELADAYMELGEFELARLWVEKAAGISPAQAFKAQTHLLYASGDVAGFDRLAAEAFERNKPREDEPLKLAQASMIPIYAISRLHLGDYRQAAHYVERVIQESPAMPRRPPHLGLYARAVLASSYQGLGDDAKAESVIRQGLDGAAGLREQVIEAYPPLTRELAKAHALLGDSEKALEYQSAAVEQGWRQYYLETQGPIDPVGRLLEDDAQYQQSLEALKSDLERMRQILRRNEWDLTPDEFFSRI